MKIAIVSDTHGMNTFFIEDIKKRQDIDHIIHLGDYTDDASIIQDATGLQVYRVRGNNDYASKDPWDQIRRYGDIKVFMTHGHKYNVYFGPQNLIYKAKEIGANLVLYGHTHVYLAEEVDGITVINPGSLSHSRGDRHTSYVILEINDGKISYERIIEE